MSVFTAFHSHKWPNNQLLEVNVQFSDNIGGIATFT